MATKTEIEGIKAEMIPILTLLVEGWSGEHAREHVSYGSVIADRLIDIIRVVEKLTPEPNEMAILDLAGAVGAAHTLMRMVMLILDPGALCPTMRKLVVKTRTTMDLMYESLALGPADTMKKDVALNLILEMLKKQAPSSEEPTLQ